MKDIHYGPREALAYNYLSDIMREGDNYTAYWDKILQMSKAAHIERIIASYAAGSQRGRIEYAMISQKDKENILRNNAKRLFGF